MKNTKKIFTVMMIFSIILSSLTVSINPTQAFWGGKKDQNENFEREEYQKGNFKKNKHKKHLYFDSITRSVENIENGVIITLTSEKAEAVEHLQNKDHREAKNESINKEVEKLENGIKITITSSDEEMVKKIQEKKAEKRFNKKGKGCQKKGCKNKCPFKDSITRSIENIENGIIITLTSEEAKAIEHLQNKTLPEPRNESVNKEVEKLENGIKVTITSENETLVEKIQNKSEKRKRAYNRQNNSIPTQN